MKNRLIALTLLFAILTSTSITFADASDVENKDTSAVTQIFDAVEKTANAINAVTKEIKASFNDLSNHWSLAYVQKLIDKNIINGYKDGTFKPDNGITVAEFTKLLMVNNQIELGDKGSKWYDEYINGARELGIIQGGEITDYNKMITRAEMARMISRSLNLKKSDIIGFEDGGIFRLYSEYIHNVANAGIVTGYEDNTFKPFKGATRGEASTMISRVSDYLDGKIIRPVVENIPEYNEDGSWTDEWFLANVEMLGCTNYYTNVGDYYFEDGKLVVNSRYFTEAKLITVEDPKQNKRLLKLIKYTVQRAYETNRYARVEHWQLGEGELTDLIRIDFSPKHMGADPAYLMVDFPLHPKEYLKANYKNSTVFKEQTADAIWRIGKCFDLNSFPMNVDTNDDAAVTVELLKHDYIIGIYGEVMHGIGEILYGSKEKSDAIINYMVKERVKDFHTEGYESYEQLKISGFQIHNNNASNYKPYFITEIE